MVAGLSPDTVVLVPDPVLVIDPGEAVMVHVPVEGSLLNATLPVGTAQVGCIMVPTLGAFGAPGTALMTIPEEAGDTQPDALVTV